MSRKKIFTQEDRVDQLERLKTALEALVPYLAQNEMFEDRADEYQASLDFTTELLTNGFTRDQLKELVAMTPDLFPKHKDWSEPMEERAGGRWVTAGWYMEVQRYFRPVWELIEALLIIGRY